MLQRNEPDTAIGRPSSRSAGCRPRAPAQSTAAGDPGVLSRDTVGPDGATRPGSLERASRARARPLHYSRREGSSLVRVPEKTQILLKKLTLGRIYHR